MAVRTARSHIQFLHSLALSDDYYHVYWARELCAYLEAQLQQPNKSYAEAAGIVVKFLQDAIEQDKPIDKNFCDNLTAEFQRNNSFTESAKLIVMFLRGTIEQGESIDQEFCEKLEARFQPDLSFAEAADFVIGLLHDANDQGKSIDFAIGLEKKPKPRKMISRNMLIHTATKLAKREGFGLHTDTEGKRKGAYNEVSNAAGPNVNLDPDAARKAEKAFGKVIDKPGFDAVWVPDDLKNWRDEFRRHMERMEKFARKK